MKRDYDRVRKQTSRYERETNWCNKHYTTVEVQDLPF